MKKIALLSVATSLIAGAFVAGVAVGKAEPPAKAKFIAVEEVKWDDLGGGPKIAQLTGDYKKGPYTGLLKLPAGFTSPVHSHSGTYEAVEISGTTSHWLKGEDGTKAKKMTPGSYWTFQGKADHVSSCAAGADCVLFVWQKTKFDFIPGKEDKAAAGSGAGSAAKPAGAGAAAPKAGAGAGSGSAAKK
ncbi:MAG TPA: DUF4437 domain-containing protein [Kofleriaceae bacterium]|jgi:hypothetical protein|nr:DUF4437 domain-containing protein [Kofleriaceae bacterium]